jgi:microsomal dipeptidase-like Zn-dependent dipeptidase
MRRFFIGLLALILVGGGVGFFFVAPAKVESNLNRVVAHEPFRVSEAAARLHREMRLADLHADTLLWDRDLLSRKKRGQVDLPRLREGGYRLQVFSAVTKTPKAMNYDENTGGTDNITLLAIAQRWPVAAWTSIAERALHQAHRLETFALRSKGALVVVRSKGDLRKALDGEALAAVLATEGAHPLEGKLENLQRLYDAGYRMLGLQHFFDNELGGSLHGVSGGGLTEFGRAAVIAADEKGMMIDVAHSSEKVAWETLELVKRPLVVSHTGLRGHCESARNVPDDLLKAIAEKGGLIGVGFWDGAVCAASLDAIGEAIVYAVKLLGEDHVALGSDFDGSVTTPIDASEADALVDALLTRGLSPAVIAKVMGENQIRFFAENLPD